MFEQYLTKTGKLSSKQPQQVKNLWYINKFKEKHGDTYDYSKVEYKTTLEKVVIICKEHGEFLQTPHNHLKGQGCPLCQGNKKKDTKQCIKDFQNVHGDLYDYSTVVYVNTDTAVEIMCKQHGSFYQTPHTHLSGAGCSECYGNKKKDAKLCIEDFVAVHGNTYDYCKVEYKNNVTKVKIICKEHGWFLQTPHSHLSGNGCPKCQVSNQNILYLLRCLDTGLVKIGITNNLKQRMSSIGGKLEYLHHITIDSPRNLEKQLHKKYQAYNQFNPTVNNGGTEFFKLTDQQLYELIQYLNSF